MFLGIIASDIKLPKLSLPTFRGETEQWIEFNDLFPTAVNKNSQNFHYLKS